MKRLSLTDDHGWLYCGFTSLNDYLNNCPGEVGDFARQIDASLKFSQPSISLAAAFSFFATIASGRVVSPDGVEPNLYCCSIAPSGSGKTQAQRIIKENLISMGLETNLMGEPVSGAALEKSLAENSVKLMLWDECGFALDAISKGLQYKADLPGIVLALYSAAGSLYIGKEYATREKLIIESPYLNIFACSTSQRFFDAIDEKFAHDGFLPRWFLFVPEDSEIKLQQPVPYSPSEAIVRIANERQAPPSKSKGNLSFLKTDKIGVEFGSIHRALEKDFDKSTAALGMHSVERVFYVRAFEQYSRLATVLGSYACEADNDVLEFSAALTRFLIQRNLEVLQQRVQPKSRQDVKDKFFSLVKDEWVTHSKLSRLAWRLNTTASQKKEWIQEAIDAGIWEAKREFIGESQKSSQLFRKAQQSRTVTQPVEELY